MLLWDLCRNLTFYATLHIGPKVSVTLVPTIYTSLPRAFQRSDDYTVLLLLSIFSYESVEILILLSNVVLLFDIGLA